MVKYTNDPMPNKIDDIRIIALEETIQEFQEGITKYRKQIADIRNECDHVFCIEVVVIGNSRVKRDKCRKCGYITN